MNHITIQFVPDKRWLVLWVTVFALVGGIALVFGRKAVIAQDELASLRAKMANVGQQIAALQPRTRGATDGATPQASQLAILLQSDLNRSFAVAESQQETGVRLRAMSYDSNVGELRLEYELDTVARAASITENLNGGIDTRPWTMQQIAAMEASAPSKSATFQPAARGTWVAVISKF